jgi:hypothetical protein
MIRKQGVLYLLCIFFLTSFGEPNNQQLSKNSTTKNNSNTKQKNYYAKHKLIDTFNNVLQKDTATSISLAQFSPIYIGAKKNELKITYNSSKVGNRIYKSGRHKKPDPKSMIISIDTTQTVGSPMGVYEYYQKTEYRVGKIAYPVFIENLSKDTLDIGFGNILPIIMEAKDENGAWKPIQKKFKYGCGKGLTQFYLGPKQLAVTTMKQFDGTFKTKLRLVFSYTTLKVYSNEIDGYINKGQFE